MLNNSNFQLMGLVVLAKGMSTTFVGYQSIATLDGSKRRKKSYGGWNPHFILQNDRNLR